MIFQNSGYYYCHNFFNFEWLNFENLSRRVNFQFILKLVHFLQKSVLLLYNSLVIKKDRHNIEANA